MLPILEQVPRFYKVFLTDAESTIEVKNDFGEMVCRKSLGYYYEGFRQIGRNEFLIGDLKEFSIDSDG